jgi:hypothetical protein
MPPGGGTLTPVATGGEQPYRGGDERGEGTSPWLVALTVVVALAAGFAIGALVLGGDDSTTRTVTRTASVPTASTATTATTVTVTTPTTVATTVTVTVTTPATSTTTP